MIWCQKLSTIGIQFSDLLENIVGKEEIACYKQFLLFPQCFQKLFVVDESNQYLWSKGLQIPNQPSNILILYQPQNVTMDQIQCIFRWQNNIDLKWWFPMFDRVENTVGKGENN